MDLTSHHVFVTGKTRTGKSKLVKGMLAELMRRGQRVVAIDPNDEYSRDALARNTDKGPLTEAMTPDELAEYPDKLCESDLSLAVVIPPPQSAKKVAEAFELVHGLLQHAGNCTVVVEECGDWADYAREDLRTFSTRGSHAGLRGIFVAQRPSLVPITSRANCESVVVFNTTEPADLEALHERTKSDEFTEAAKGLPLGECLVWPPLKERH